MGVAVVASNATMQTFLVSMILTTFCSALVAWCFGSEANAPGNAISVCKVKLFGVNKLKEESPCANLLITSIVLSISQRLQAIDEGWVELHQMWDNRQMLLSQSLNHQMFLRDARQADMLLNQQDTFLAKVEQPVSTPDC